LRGTPLWSLKRGKHVLGHYVQGGEVEAKLCL
jgi:hypothetical protein